MSDLSRFVTAACVPPGMSGHSPEIKRISVEMISAAPDRLRTPDRGSVDVLRRSIKEHGVLQPIGVRINPARRADPPAPESARYLLVWGGTRAAAVRLLVEEARRNGDEDGACRYAEIPAYVFDEDTPAGFVRRFEIVENLHRKELSRDERKHQAAMLLALVAEEMEKGGSLQNGENSNGRKPTSGPKGGRPKGAFAVASDVSGIPQGTLRRHVDDASDMAGVTIDESKPLALQFQEVAEKCEEKIQAKKSQKAKAGDAFPIKIRPGDPSILIRWFEARHSEGIVTVENVIAYRDALSAWIEAKTRREHQG